MAVKRQVVRRASSFRPKGSLIAYERRVGEKLWRPVLESENVIINTFYIDFFGQVSPSPPGGMSLVFSNLALGTADSPTFARTDLGLAHEWSTIATTLSAPTGTTAITSLAVKKLPYKIASGQVIQLVSQNVTLSADANLGDTTISVVSFVPSINYITGTGVTYNNPALLVPQRLSATIGLVDPADPPSVTLSFYLPAAANLEPIAFTEAALFYNVGVNCGSHVAFAYTKDGNTDLRVDYMLARESD